MADSKFTPEFEEKIKKFGYILEVMKMDEFFVKLKMIDNFQNIVFEKIFKVEDKDKYKKIIELFREHPIDNKKNILDILESDNDYATF